MPATDCVVGGSELDRLVVQQHLALVRGVQPVKDVHQGRFAGPVLAQKRDHLARRHLEIDIVVGKHTRKTLGYTSKLERQISLPDIGSGATLEKETSPVLAPETFLFLG